MGAIDLPNLPRGPNLFHPEKPSAVGSRNSLAQEYRDQQSEVNQLLEEETNKVVHHLTARLPKDVLERLDVMGGLKEKLYNYFNQNYQNMFNRYMVTSEDEMVKKVRNLIDKEETKVLTRYTPKEVAELLETMGGAEKFNTGEIEKSVVSMYGQLQGHIQRGINELEAHTNSILRQKTDVGAFVRGENAYSIVKCSFKDNLGKPKTVSDVKLSVNILDSELISPIFHYQVTVEYLIKDMLGKRLINDIDRAVERLQSERIEQGQSPIPDSEIIFSKIAQVENFTDDKPEDPASKRYSLVAKSVIDKIEGLRAELDPANYDQLGMRENILRIMDLENVRNRGFNTAVNSITAILDDSKMGYQYIENLKNAREVVIREYEDTDPASLPDERYQIRLRYFDAAQLLEDRKAYDVQIKSFETEVQHLWDMIEVIYQDSKPTFKVADFDDLARKMRPRIQKRIKAKTNEPLYEDVEKVWDKISFVRAGETDVEKSNRTYLYEKDRLRKRLLIMRDRLKVMYGFLYPAERRIMEEELGKLEREYDRFEYTINPYHIQPGLLLDLDITSIKRKKATLDSMANVLNEFLQGVSKGFQDAALSSFSKRREETTQTATSPEAAAEASYLDLITPEPAAPAPEPAKPAKTGAVDKKPSRRGGAGVPVGRR